MRRSYFDERAEKGLWVPAMNIDGANILAYTKSIAAPPRPCLSTFIPGCPLRPIAIRRGLLLLHGVDTGGTAT